MSKTFHRDDELAMRLFYVLAWTAMIANTIGYLSNAILYGWTPSTVFSFVCALVMYVAGAAGFIWHTHKIPGFIILMICNFVEFPVMYCVYGPARIGYMFLGVVGVVLFLGREWRWVGAGVVIALDAVLVLCRNLNLDAFLPYSQQEKPIAAFMDFVIASASITVMLVVLLHKYEMQQLQLQEMSDELQEMVHLDPLTKLYNRRFLTEHLDEKITRGDNEFAVALLDIDDFKKINDTYGHVYGDETLTSFAKIMMKHMEGQGIAARFGGEEFMLVFDHTDLVKIRACMDKMKVEFAAFGRETKNIEMSFSGGVEVFQQEDRIMKLFNAADEKLYHAKHLGKNKVVFDEAEFATQIFVGREIFKD